MNWTTWGNPTTPGNLSALTGRKRGLLMADPDQRFSTGPRTAEVTERGWRAVQLRAQRRTFQEIADELGYGSKASAYKAYVRHLTLMRRDSPEAELVRIAESAHLDYLRPKVMPAVEDGDLAAIDRAVRISERFSKLNGLDLNESRAAGALEAGAVAQLMASSNLHAIIIAAMGEIGMTLDQQDQLIAAINVRLEQHTEPQEGAEPEPPTEHLAIESETEWTPR